MLTQLHTLPAPLPTLTLSRCPKQSSNSQMSQFGPQAQANIAWALAKLQYSPHPSWLRSFIAQSMQNLPVSPPPSLACLAVGMAKLGHVPEPAWLDAFLMASVRHLRRQVAVAAEVQGAAAEAGRKRWDGRRREAYERQQRAAESLVGDGQQQQQPEEGDGGGPVSGGRAEAVSRALDEAALPAAEAAASAGFNPQELANIVWALPRLRGGGNPPPRSLFAWLESAEAAALALMPLSSAQNVSNIVLAASRQVATRPPSVKLLQAASLRLVWLLQNGEQVRPPGGIVGLAGD